MNLSLALNQPSWLRRPSSRPPSPISSRHRMTRCSVRERMLLFMLLLIGSLSLLASHLAYRGATETNHVEHIGPSHLLEPKQGRRARRALILDLGHPVLQVSADVVQVSSEALVSAGESAVAVKHKNVGEGVRNEENDDKPDAQPVVGKASGTKSDPKSNDEEANGEDENQPDDDPTPATTVWNQRTEPTANTTFPIINVGLPRSGEDTIYNFFHNLGFNTQYGCGDMKQPRPGCTQLGVCIKRNVVNNAPALEGCSTPHMSKLGENLEEFQVYTQLQTDRFLIIKKPYRLGLILPQIWYLNELYQYAPHATWLLPLHLPRHWAFTVSRHKTLRHKIWSEISVEEHSARVPVTKWSIFRPELLEIQAVDYWEEYYSNHTTRIREFVKSHPTIRLVELEYRRPRAPLDLIESLAIPLPKPNIHVPEQWECMRNECDLWEDNLKVIEHYKTTPRPKIKLPTPIFVVGFPKSGTTSVFNFFSCAGAISQHYCCCGDVADHRPCYSLVMAECILDNKENGRPMLQGCGEYDLYAQLDGERTYYPNGKLPEKDMKTEDKKAGHFLPQVFELEQIHAEYPNATFILPLRDSDDWAQSVSRWFNMRHRIKTEYLIMNRSEEVEVERPLVNIYEQHTKNVIRFVQKYPSHKLIKFQISQPDVGRMLAEESGLPESCWGHHNKNTRSRKY